MVAQTAIRLATTGKAEVQQDFAETQKAGEGAFQEIAASAEAASQKIATAAERAAERQQASYRRMAAAEKVAAVAGANQEAFNAALGAGGSQQVATVNFDRTTGSAREAAAAFEEMLRREDAAILAAEKLAAASASAAAEMRATAGQGSINAALGARGSSGQIATVNLAPAAGSARASAEAFQEMFAAEEQAQRAALQLRAAIDPLWQAEQRLEEELRRISIAEKAEILTSEQLAQAQAEARQRYDQTTEAIRRQGQVREGALSLMQRQTLIYTASDVVASASSGMSPAMIAMQQGPQVLQAFAAEEGGMAKLLAIINPTTIGIAALSAAVLAGAASWLSYANAMDRQTAIAQGAGRVIGATGEQLEANAEIAARAGDISVSAARGIEAGYVQLGGIGSNVLAGLTALTGDFATATGQDAAAAQQQLGAAFQDPIKGAEELAARYGVLTQEQIDHIQKLVEQGDLYGAQAELLHALEPRFDGAADHANGLALAWRWIKNEASDAWTAMGRAIDVALGGGTKLDQLKSLQNRRDTLAAKGWDTAGVDTDIARLRAELAAERAKGNAAGANAARQRAADVAGNYQGDDRDQIQRRIGTLRAGIAAGGSADQLKVWTDALSANQHALNTWMPAQDKANKLAAIDAQLAVAKTPAQKAALAAERERVELSGKVVTAADAEAQATSKGAVAKTQAERSGSSHAATLAREAAAMTASARSALDVAAAYLQTDAAGAEAEARRKALTDATKQGGDVEGQVRRQLALSVADSAASSAKSVSQLKIETAARRDVSSQVEAGTLTIGRMGDALSDEAAMRDLTVKGALAYKLGLTDTYEAITRTIAAYRQALSEAHQEEAHGQALQSLDALRQRAEDARLGMRFAGDTSGAADLARARLSAGREADSRGYSDNDRAAVTAGAVSAASAELEEKRAQSVAGVLASQRDAAEIGAVQLSTIRASAVEQQRMLDRVRAEQTLRAAGVDLASEQAQKVLAGVDAESALNARVKLVQDSMAEVNDLGSKFIDDLTNPNGAGIKSLLRDVENELIKLAAINPLKNLLTGGGAPTLGSVLGLFSGAGSLTAGRASGLASLASTSGSMTSSMLAATAPHFAAGSQYTSGGMAWVGENGPELISMPSGSRVTNAADTRRMLSATNDRGGGVTHNHFTGNLMTPEFWAQIQAGDDNAAARGTAGGAQLSASEARRSRRRSMVG